MAASCGIHALMRSESSDTIILGLIKAPTAVLAQDATKRVDRGLPESRPVASETYPESKLQLNRASGDHRSLATNLIG